MNKDFFDLLLLLEFALALANTNVLLLPVLGADRVLSGLDNDALEGLDADAHLVVQLLLY